MDEFGRKMNDILLRIYRNVDAVENAALRNMNGGELSISEIHTIECVARGEDEGRSVSDIAQELGVTLASATVALQKLERKGYVIRERCRQDGRRVLVRLSRAGHRAEVGHRYFHRQMALVVEKAIPREDQAALLRGLSTIDDFLASQAEQARRRSVKEEDEGK